MTKKRGPNICTCSIAIITFAYEADQGDNGFRHSTRVHPDVVLPVPLIADVQHVAGNSSVLDAMNSEKDLCRSEEKNVANAAAGMMEPTSEHESYITVTV